MLTEKLLGKGQGSCTAPMELEENSDSPWSMARNGYLYLLGTLLGLHLHLRMSQVTCPNPGMRVWVLMALAYCEGKGSLVGLGRREVGLGPGPQG